MMTYRSDDPGADFDRYDRDRAEAEASRPVCCECGDPIWDEYLWDIGGDLYCEECAQNVFRKDADFYVQ